MSSEFAGNTSAPAPSDGNRPPAPVLEVFYDSDCGFCARCARALRRLDRRHSLEMTPIQRVAETAGDAPSAERLLETMHVRDTGGSWSSGGVAWLRIVEEVPALRPVGWFARLPLVRHGVEPTYAFIAANRHRVSRLLGDGNCGSPGSRP